jgi:hypothetical protein
MLDKKISLKDLLVITIFLVVAFTLSGYFSEHPVIDTKLIFTGAILGAVVTFLMGIYFAYTKKLVFKSVEE